MNSGRNVKNIDQLIEMSSKGSMYDDVISGVERILISRALAKSFGNQSLAAKLLGINRNTLRAKMRKYTLRSDRFKL